MILTTNIMVLLMSNNFYILNAIVFIASIGAFFINFYFLNNSFSSSNYGLMNRLLNSPIIMFSNILTICMTVILSYIFK